MRKIAVVAVNERGRRIGESHPRAKLTDREVDLLRELVDNLIGEGMKPMQAYRTAAEKFEVHVRSAKKIVYCERRAQYPDRFKRR
jgi:hypothetical protein